jgi:hypothetical protein
LILRFVVVFQQADRHGKGQYGKSDIDCLRPPPATNLPHNETAL